MHLSGKLRFPCKFNMYFKYAIDAAHFFVTLFREYMLSFEFVTYA